MIETAIITMMTQTPALGGLIWFLIHHTKQTDKRFEKQAEQFAIALNTIVEKIGVHIDDIDADLEKMHTVLNINRKTQINDG